MYAPFAIFALAGSISTTAMARNIQARQNFSTGAPLTLTLSLTPSPTQTDAVVSSAYAAYSQACGPEFARAIQDGLAVYNGLFPDAATTNVSDPQFLAWTVQGDPDYTNASNNCQNLFGRLGVLEGNTDAAASTTTISSGTASATGHTVSSTGNSKVAPASTTGAASSVPSTNGAAAKTHRPQVLFLIGAIWVVRCALLD